MSCKQGVWLLAGCLACFVVSMGRADEPTPTQASIETAAPAANTVPEATAAASAEPSAGAARPPDASTIDLGVLLDQHLVIVRLHLRRGPTSFMHVWQEFVERKFAAADKDQNGVLDAEEFKLVKPLLTARRRIRTTQARFALPGVRTRTTRSSSSSTR